MYSKGQIECIKAYFVDDVDTIIDALSADKKEQINEMYSYMINDYLNEQELLARAREYSGGNFAIVVQSVKNIRKHCLDERATVISDLSRYGELNGQQYKGLFFVALLMYIEVISEKFAEIKNERSRTAAMTNELNQEKQKNIANNYELNAEKRKNLLQSEELNEERRRNAEKEAALQRLREDNSNYQQAVDVFQNKFTQYQKEKDDIQRELQRLKPAERLIQIEYEISEIALSIERKLEKKSVEEIRISQLHSEIDALNTEIDKLRADRMDPASLMKQIAAYGIQINEKNSKLKSLQKEIIHFIEDGNVEEASIKGQEHKVEKAAINELEQRRNAAKELLTKRHHVEDGIKKLTATFELRDKSLASHESKIISLNQEIELLNNEKELLNQELALLKYTAMLQLKPAVSLPKASKKELVDDKKKSPDILPSADEFLSNVKLMHIDKVETFLKRGMNANTKNAENQTALHIVCNQKKTGQKEIIKMLLKCGADPLMEDNKHKRPVDYANSNGCFDCVQILEDASSPKYDKKYHASDMHTDTFATSKVTLFPASSTLLRRQHDETQKRVFLQLQQKMEDIEAEGRSIQAIQYLNKNTVDESAEKNAATARTISDIQESISKDKNHWYYAGYINALLNKIFSTTKIFAAHHAISLSSKFENPEVLSQLVFNNLSAKYVYVPVNLNNTHWIGLLFNTKDNCAYYIDPKGNTCSNEMKIELMKLGIGEKNIFNMTVKLQAADDNINCGLFVCEIGKMLSRLRTDKITALLLKGWLEGLKGNIDIMKTRTSHMQIVGESLLQPVISITQHTIPRLSVNCAP